MAVVYFALKFELTLLWSFKSNFALKFELTLLWSLRFRSIDIKILDGGLVSYNQYTENKKIPPDILSSVKIVALAIKRYLGSTVEIFMLRSSNN